MINPAVLIDTGPIVALMSSMDSQHGVCSETLGGLVPPLLTCWPVLTEAAWLLRKEPRAIQKLFSAFDQGLFAVLELDAPAMAWIGTLMSRYESANIQLADASLAYLAEREQIRTLFTLDRRDFSIIRLKHNRMLRMIPDWDH